MRATPTKLVFRTVLGVLLCLATGAAPSVAQAPREEVYLGVATCAGSTCHGAIDRLKGAAVAQNEYITWSRKDKHAKAYAVLLEERSQRIARNLGLANAHTAAICLDCHADNVPADKQGRQFQLTDGVGCEACHGAAKSWLGVHISGVEHRENLAAGLYPTEQPKARAEKCLACHFGDDKRFVTHRIMGAGHPRLSFELDTFTALEPAHFTIDKSYIERKGPVNGVQVWAVGQAIALVKFMDALADAKRGPSGIFPELALFDCQACHHSLSQLRWQPRASTGLGPGMIKLYDANAVMLRVIAARVAPAQGKALAEHMRALHRATTEDWGAVQHQAREVRSIADQLAPLLSEHNFGRDDMLALAEALVEVGVTRDDVEYAGAEQTAMALSAIVSALGHVDEERGKTLNRALNGLYESLAKDETYRPEAYVASLRDFQKVLLGK